MLKKITKCNDNNLAIAYYRYSSHAQNEASIEQQREAAARYASAHGFTIVREYEDKAISGRTEERPGFQLMLSEIGKIKPAALILWKTDRLARDRVTSAIAKQTIRNSGCVIHYVAEAIPQDSAESVLMEGLLESMAEFYSEQLRQNIVRGMNHNAEQCLYNGRRILGYKPEEGKKAGKRIEIDPKTAPIVQRIFADYASGKPLKTIVTELNEQGLRSVKDGAFTINSLRRILHNEVYTGVYKHGDIIIPDGIPALVSKEQFAEVQARFAANKRTAAQQRACYEDEEAPRYWLTGKLYCGYCGESMQGMSGTSRNGAKYYYYSCSNQRRKKCHKKPIKKAVIEWLVIKVLRSYIEDQERLASLAVDAADHYKRYYADTGYLESLQADLKETEKALYNLVRAIEAGIFSETTRARLTQLETRKKALNEAIEVEKVKRSMMQDEHSIGAYFKQYENANLDDPEARDFVLNYFVDKIYVYDDHIEVTGFYSEDRCLIEWEEYKEGIDYNILPNWLLEEFDTLAQSSTKAESDELLFLAFGLCGKGDDLRTQKFCHLLMGVANFVLVCEVCTVRYRPQLSFLYAFIVSTPSKHESFSSVN